jgi:hypothetical protein
MPDKYRPRLKHSDVNKNGIVQLGQFLTGVGKAADLWAGDVKAARPAEAGRTSRTTTNRRPRRGRDLGEGR